MPAFSFPEHPMKWDEFQASIRTAMAVQPRGYQSKLARDLSVTPGYIHQLVTGHRAIPPELLPAILSSLEVDYNITIHAKKE